jgi:poly(hydroxyalkanoate) depolymerase family esterase
METPMRSIQLSNSFLNSRQVLSMSRRIIVGGITWLVLAAVMPSAYAVSLSEVSGFGTNPGNLRMFKFVPDNLQTNPPLVVALHGCTQTASAYDDETGWVKFAEALGFALLLPEQKTANNEKRCFNWFEPGDIKRNQGEALSIKQMVDKMMADHDIDPEKIFVTGLSAGGSMTAVMLATYPDVFAGGAVIAGLPFDCAHGLIEASRCLFWGKNLSPFLWARMVREATNHTGSWPRVSIWQGSFDSVVRPINATELTEQWTGVHNIDQVPDEEDIVNGHSHMIFKDAKGNPLVETFLIQGMDHGTPIDPGASDEQCGTTAPYILDANVCSSLHIAKFWSLSDEISSGEASMTHK